MAALALLGAAQSRDLAEREIAALETQLLNAKRAELRNYISIARTAIGATYGNALPDDEDAKVEVMQTLAAMLYGQDGYFFVFDYDGKNLVAPRQTQLINQNWLGLRDIDVSFHLCVAAKIGARSCSAICATEPLLCRDAKAAGPPQPCGSLIPEDLYIQVGAR